MKALGGRFTTTVLPTPLRSEHRAGTTWRMSQPAKDRRLRYEVTVDNPRTWTARWTAALNPEPNPEGVFEYACHE